MSVGEVVVEGTLKPDGTLELHQRPNLSPGRVTVVLRQESQAASVPTGNWWENLQHIRAEREASGYPFMNEEEVKTHIDWLREEDRIDELLRDASAQGGNSRQQE